ncbi:hypothetical protein D0T90_06075 [Neisseria animalis]|uniref:Uncharacterized protein n=1 Tax=Neisseria animalis TaxID=492 RepID=A0A5P3MRM9_NEIAN|nr:hypothetical protein D0T90_06075 [Neisseria animalis]ROW32678.1 hypothetical protein CGZ60_04415 [Neisseria animalis]
MAAFQTKQNKAVLYRNLTVFMPSAKRWHNDLQTAFNARWHVPTKANLYTSRLPVKKNVKAV